MLTITDRATTQSWPIPLCCAVAVGAWFAGLAVAALAFEPTRQVVVVAANRDAAIASIARADVALVHASDNVITVVGRSRGFVRELYSGGAWLVLPASNGGCRGRSNGRAGLVN
jgi:hypothetical protein